MCQVAPFRRGRPTIDPVEPSPRLEFASAILHDPRHIVLFGSRGQWLR